MTQHEVWIVFGPTASGKSAFAARIAENRPSVIINADSQQLYRELRVLTARPTAEEEAVHPHRLYGALAGDDPASAARWAAMAAAAVREAWDLGRLPVVVGGTGLYLQTLMEGIAPIPDVPADVREETQRLWETRGETTFRALLAEGDPALAATLKPGDRQRLVRAMEVWRATGRALSDWQRDPPTLPLPEATFRKTAVTLPREELYARCDARFAQMLEQGALEEVKSLLAFDYAPALPVMRAVGVPELAAYLRGDLTLETAAERARQSTRNYAKRQMTWLRGRWNDTSTTAARTVAAR